MTLLASPVIRTAVVFFVPLAVGIGAPRILQQIGLRSAIFVLAAFALAGIGLGRHSFAVVATLGAFVASGLLRRLYPAIDATADPMAIFPFIVAIPLAARGLLARKSPGMIIFVAWISIAAGVSLGSPVVAVAAWLNLAVPLLAGIEIAASAGALRTLVRTLVVLCTLASTYGIIQYYVPLSWDLTWLERSGFVSAGQFGESTFRPFATYASVGTAATVAAVALLVILFRWELTGFGRTARVLCLIPTTAYLLLAQVRAVWIAIVVALLVGFMVARDRPNAQIVVLVIIGALVLVLIPQGQVLGDRIGTLAEIGQDRSYQSRLGLLSGAGELVSPVGTGLGRFSAASRAEGGGGIDNGYLIILGETGLVGLALLVWVLYLVSRQGGRSGGVFLTLLLVMSLAGFAFANVPGLLLWSLAGARAVEPFEEPGRLHKPRQGPSARLVTLG